MTHPTDELALLNKLIELGAAAAQESAKANSDDGMAGSIAQGRFYELRHQMRALLAEQARTEPVGHVNMQIKAGCGDGIKWTGWALPHGTPLYAAPLLTHKADAEPSNMVQAERDRCAAIADDEAAIREKAGLTHPEDSPARDRCFAGARAAANVARGIRNGEVLETHKAEDAPTERDAQDAARYRWLRDGELTADYPYPVMRMGGSRVDDQTIWNDELDAAIDAAMAKD